MAQPDRTFLEWVRPLHELIDSEKTHTKCGEWSAVRHGNWYILTQWRYIPTINAWEAFYSLSIPRD